MSPDVWQEVRDAVGPSVAAGQMLPHRAAQIASRYRVDIQDVIRIYSEQRELYVARVRAAKAAKAAQVAAGLDIRPTPGTQTVPEAEPEPEAVAAPEPQAVAESLREPARVANPEPGVDCDYCDAHVRDNYVMAQHIRQAHPELLTHECHVCDTRSLSRNALRQHYRKKHPGVDLPPESAGHSPAQSDMAPIPATAAVAGMQAARDIVTAFTSADQPEAVTEAAHEALGAIDHLQDVLNEITSELTARAQELRAELARLEAQLAQVQEAAA